MKENEEPKKKQEERIILNNFPLRLGKHNWAVRPSTKKKRDLEREIEMQGIRESDDKMYMEN
jgi:hypothetical protein